MRWITDRTLVRTLLLVAGYLRAAPLQALPRCWLGSRRAPRTLQRQRQYRVAGWRGPGSGLTWFSCLPAFPRPFPISQVPVNPPSPPQPPGVFQCFWSDPKTRVFECFSEALYCFCHLGREHLLDDFLPPIQAPLTESDQGNLVGNFLA